jgi:hypothetical protein
MALSAVMQSPVPVPMPLDSLRLSIPPQQTHAAESRLREINLLLSLQQGLHQADAMSYDTIQVFADETIKNIKLRLRNRGWFTSKHCLVFGERELLEHEKIADVATSSEHPSNFLNVLVRLSDIEAATIRTMSRDISLNHLTEQNQRQSALTAALKDSPRLPTSFSCRTSDSEESCSTA